MAQRYNVRLKSEDKIEELLQEIYNQSCEELLEIQGEINKLAAAPLIDATMEERTKYAKAMNDFANTKLKSLQMKFEIAKFMGEIIKHNGDLGKTLNDPVVGKTTKLDIAGWRDIVNKAKDEPNSQVYDLK